MIDLIMGALLLLMGSLTGLVLVGSVAYAKQEWRNMDGLTTLVSMVFIWSLLVATLTSLIIGWSVVA